VSYINEKTWGLWRVRKQIIHTQNAMECKSNAGIVLCVCAGQLRVKKYVITMKILYSQWKGNAAVRLDTQDPRATTEPPSQLQSTITKTSDENVCLVGQDSTTQRKVWNNAWFVLLFDSKWSLSRQNICQECDAMTLFTPKMQHIRCLPCAYEMRAVLSYVESILLENGALQYESEDGKAKTIFLRQSTLEEVGVHFYIDESACVEKEIVTAVSRLLKVRKKCDAGQQLFSLVPTKPTVCTPCEDGTFSDQVNAQECRLLTPCSGATFWDAGNKGMEYSVGTHGSVSDSLCELDFDYISLARGLYPVIEDGFEFTYNQLRTHRISRYSPCMSSLVAKEAENTQIKCGVDMSSCMHDFFGQCKLGLISMGGSVNVCQYKCAGGYSQIVLAGQEICQECVAGTVTYKNSSSSQDFPCEKCAAGSISASAKSQVCTLCGPGTLSSVYNTRCEDECVPGIKYCENHACYTPTRHCVTDLSNSGLATHTINVQMCPISGAVLSSEHVWVQTDSESSKIYVEYPGVGLAWCFPVKQCTIMQQVDIATGVCRKCDNVENAVQNVFLLTGKCVPRCNAGF